ncbi:MAG: DpnI domain-containing protein [bacterium]|nr:DpnI domain-containing protein [bacterium]
MILNLDKKLIADYESPSQKTRVLTETWVGNQIFCPNCGHLKIDKYPNNKPVADFYCSICREGYELKSKQNAIGSKIVDGAYKTMMERLESSENPNLFLLSYDITNFEVIDFLVVPKHFFVPEIIEKRKPLSPTARRAEWVGCNISLQNLPLSGKIFFVRNHNVEPKERVLSQWQKTLFLRDEKEISAKGWLLDIMRCVDKLGKREFILNEMYRFESELSLLHPENKHIKDKIRQQLQILRDKGYLDFISKGFYRLA